MLPALVFVLVPLVGGAVAGALLHFWPRISLWAHNHLLPWVDRNLPMFAHDIRLVFGEAERLASAARAVIKDAWQRIRSFLLSQVVEFLRVPGSDKWIVRITSYLKQPEGGDKRFVRRISESEEALSWEDLPPHVRSHLLREGVDDVLVDMVDVHDRLLTETN
ncbi:hypothetical protein ACQPZZ_14625 [Microbispora sp. CA-135349]|uniref:hypothetical protein n=1 Tax=Microbispora sp. CA-135349 TaxID=3239953 RepID=UPI003D8EA773